MSCNHEAVAHAWAHQTGKHCNGYAMFYDGATIYSYGRHFAIARLTTVEGVGQVVLFTSRVRNSLSTSTHKSTVRTASSHLPMVFVHDVGHFPNLEDHSRSIKEAGECVAKANRARKNAGYHLAEAAGHIANANTLNEWFRMGLEPVRLESLDVSIAGIEARIAAEKERQEAEGRAAQAQRYLEDAGKRDAWWDGDATSGQRALYSENGGALLRVEGDTLETSFGATVPLSHAIKVFQFVKARRAEGRAWKPTGHSIRVGDFLVDSIAPNGDFHAGCHFIEWSEVERLAKRLGVFDLTASDAAVQVVA